MHVGKGKPGKPMAPPKKCPKCEIISQPGTTMCACGYVFSPEHDATVYRQRSRSMMINGSGLIILGVGLFLLLDKVDNSAGFRMGFRVALGLVVGGFALLLGGLKRLTRTPS